MITSLRRWCQRDFTVIGLAYNLNSLCLVQIELFNGKYKVGPWFQTLLPTFHDSPLRGKIIESALKEKNFTGKYLAATLWHEMIDPIFLKEEVGSTPTEQEVLFARALAQSDYVDLSNIAVAHPEKNNTFMLVCKKSYVNHHLELAQSVSKELISLDWQFLSYFRAISCLLKTIAFFPQQRIYILNIINKFEILQLEALGAAINGVMYVAM